MEHLAASAPRANRLVFVTYADGAFEQNIEPNLAAARRFMKVDHAVAFTRRDLEAGPLYQPHRDVFDAPRGRGYWAWKPWVILEAMSQCRDGDVVIYQDCGFGPRYRAFMRPRRLVEMARSCGFVAGVMRKDYGPNRRWIHANCLSIVARSPQTVSEGPVIEATLSAWTVGDSSRRFLQTWLKHCLDLEAVRDVTADEMAAQSPDFREHRHDQAILTILALEQGAAIVKPVPALEPFSKSVSAIELSLRAKSDVLLGAALSGLGVLLRVRRRLKGLTAPDHYG